MIDIIAGAKGKGKTKILIQQVNDDIKLTKGTIVYLDKNNKHMYELSNQIRLIVVPEFNVTDIASFPRPARRLCPRWHGILWLHSRPGRCSCCAYRGKHGPDFR